MELRFQMNRITCINALATVLMNDTHKVVVAEGLTILDSILHFDTKTAEKLIQKEAMDKLCIIFVNLLNIINAINSPEVEVTEGYEKKESLRSLIIREAAFVSGSKWLIGFRVVFLLLQRSFVLLSWISLWRHSKM